MRKSTLAFLSFALVPTIAFALTIEPATLYTDVRASAPESVGINMLTRAGIVQGYGNGFFGFTRQINRAEFLKIAILGVGPAESSTLSCFPDVAPDDWFRPFVCAAKEIGIVSGKADTGFFDPSGTVTYGEALKMLVNRFYCSAFDGSGCVDPSDRKDNDHWAEPFYRAAAAKGLDLPMTITLDTPLTRALAARLIAAFVAEREGRLSEFRLAEGGQYTSSSSSMKSSLSSSSSSSSMSISSSSESSAPLFTLPPVSHFLMLGQVSDAIADLTLPSRPESVRIVSAQVKLVSPVASLDTLELVTAIAGQHVATLQRRTTSDTSDYLQTYEVQLAGADQVRIPADQNMQLVLRAKIRGADTGGFSDQLIEVRTFSVTFHGETTQETVNVPAIAPFPKHQTSFGRITAVSRVSPASAPLVSGTDQLISSFGVKGTVLAGKTLSLKQLTFDALSSGSVFVTNWHIQIPGGSVAAVPCSINQATKVLSCPNLDSIGAVPSDTSLVLEVRADVAVPAGSTGSMLELDLNRTGSPSEFGSVQWTDQAGNFKWIEGTTPLAQGTKLE